MDVPKLTETILIPPELSKRGLADISGKVSVLGKWLLFLKDKTGGFDVDRLQDDFAQEVGEAKKTTGKLYQAMRETILAESRGSTSEEKWLTKREFNTRYRLGERPRTYEDHDRTDLVAVGGKANVVYIPQSELQKIGLSDPFYLDGINGVRDEVIHNLKSRTGGNEKTVLDILGKEQVAQLIIDMTAASMVAQRRFSALLKQIPEEALQYFQQGHGTQHYFNLGLYQLYQESVKDNPDQSVYGRYEFTPSDEVLSVSANFLSFGLSVDRYVDDRILSSLKGSVRFQADFLALGIDEESQKPEGWVTHFKPHIVDLLGKRGESADRAFSDDKILSLNTLNHPSERRFLDFWKNHTGVLDTLASLTPKPS